MANEEQLNILESLNQDAPFLHAKDLYVIYEGKGRTENVVALSGLNLKIEKGEFLAVVGPSGSGKSSLLRVLGGLQIPSAGNVFFQGVDIGKYGETELVSFRREKIGFVFQEDNLIPSYTGFQNVVKTLRYAGSSFTEAEKRAEEVLDMLGMKSRMHALPHKMSGGERQRIGIARALANEPEFILADEPTGNIDYDNTNNVMGIFKDLHDDLQTSFLVVTHSDHVASFTDRRLELRDGKFTGQLKQSVKLDQLTEARSIIINDDGSMTFPPEMQKVFNKYGYLWDFRFETGEGKPKIIGIPSSGDEGNKDENKPLQCPVCDNTLNKDEFFCTSCGAKVKEE